MEERIQRLRSVVVLSLVCHVYRLGAARCSGPGDGSSRHPLHHADVGPPARGGRLGPYPLGADEPASPPAWQYHDLEILLVETRRRGIPLIIASASDTGTRRGVDQYARMMEDIAARHDLPPFRLARIYADVPLGRLRRLLEQGVAIRGLDGRPDLTPADLDRTSRAVAVMGAEPIVAALDAGTDVVICGRSSDAAIFAAAALWCGMPPATAYYAGKVLECASFCAEPFRSLDLVPRHPVPGRAWPDGGGGARWEPGRRPRPRP